MGSADNNEWVNARHSVIHGQGLFARKVIPPETEIIEYIGEKIDKVESESRCLDLLDEAEKTGGAAVYMFTLNDVHDLDGNTEDNDAKLINHSCDPNCEAQIDEEEEEIWIVALREIQKEEELSFNYGFDLASYEDHPCLCGSDNCVGYIVDQDSWPDLKRALASKKAKAKRKEKRLARREKQSKAAKA